MINKSSLRAPLASIVLLLPALLGGCGDDPEKIELRHKLAEAEARAALAERKANPAVSLPSVPIAPAIANPAPPAIANDQAEFGAPMDDTQPIEPVPAGNDGNPEPLNQ
jgi:hypothetical protein